MKSFAVERDNGGLNIDIEVRDHNYFFVGFHFLSECGIGPKHHVMIIILLVIINFQELGSPVCPRTGKICSGRHFQRLNVSDCGPQWFRPLTLGDISTIFATGQSKKIKFLAGDTGKGL